jgi:hypothetical protein
MQQEILVHAGLVAFHPTFRTLSVTLKYLTLKALTGKGYAILVQMNYLRLIENNLILLR